MFPRSNVGWVGCVAAESTAVAFFACGGSFNCAGFGVTTFFAARLLDFFVGAFLAAFLLTFFVPFFVAFFIAAFFTAFLVVALFACAFFDPVFFLAIGCSFGEQA